MKRILCIAAVLLVLGGLPLAVQASPDLTRTGSITFTLVWEEAPIDSGALTLYQVGTVAPVNDTYAYVPVEALADAAHLDDLTAPELARDLARLVQERELSGVTAPIRHGEAVFTDLTLGVYLVTQEPEDACDGFAPISPFLITVPQYADGVYIYDIAAQPKVPLHTEPTEPPSTDPTKPTEPNLPQTGQLHWPVPVLAVSGITIFLLGWAMRTRKREHHEA